MRKKDPVSKDRVGLTLRLDYEVFRKFKMALASKTQTTQDALEQMVRDYITQHEKG